MKRTILTLAILIAATISIFGQSKDEQMIRQGFDQMTGAMLKDDFAAMERLLSDDFTYVGINGRKQNRAERLATIKNSTWSFASLNRDIESVRVMGDTAVVVSRTNFVGKDKKTGETFKGANRSTTTLAKRGGKWTAIASQTTREITPTDENTLGKFMTDFTAALLKNSADAVAPFYDDHWIMVNANGTTTSREQQLADLRSGDLKYGTISVDEKSMRMFGPETAVAVAKFTLVGSSYKGRDISGSYRATSVLRKADADRWVVVSQQVTKLN